MRATRLPGSFRDPAGHVFVADGTLYRHVSPAGREAYQRLMESGLYDALAAGGLLLPHEDLGSPGGGADEQAATVIRAERIPMVSYPYEWCFSQLREAALLTLRLQREAMRFGMSLKDASAYNVQLRRGRPVLIDTLSFEARRPGPWVAYRQFCRHFYAPLLLSRTEAQLARLQQVFIDGVPLGVASKLLPARTWVEAGPLMHIHLHAAADRRLAGVRSAGLHGQARIDALIDSLERAVRAVHWKPRGDWASYYADQPSYGPEAFTRKLKVVSAWLDRLKPSLVWDLGANTGRFSRIAARHAELVVAFDADPACVETMYCETRAEGSDRLLPLVADLTSPSPAIGWANSERLTLDERGPADAALALAFTHHLAIGNNVPLDAIAGYFARLARQLIVEFVPKSDPMVQRMLASRDDIFSGYGQEQFERAFEAAFRIEQRAALAPSDRMLYLMTAR
jgi:hypothetical protein